MKKFRKHLTEEMPPLLKSNIVFEEFEIDVLPEEVDKDLLEEDLKISLENKKVTILRNPVGVHGYISETGAYFNLPALPNPDIMTMSPEDLMMHRVYLLLTIKFIINGLEEFSEEETSEALDKVIKYNFLNEMEKTEVDFETVSVKTVPANSFIHMYIVKK